MAKIITDISIEDPAWLKKRLGLQKMLEIVLTDTWKHVKGKSKASPLISAVFTNDEAIRKINKKFRKKNKPTNVLSFQVWPQASALPPTIIPAGDLVFAIETIEREAREARISFKHHLTHLMVHGFLHLFGYDHMNDEEAEIMEALEIKILKKMGVKNPYAEDLNSDKP